MEHPFADLIGLRFEALSAGHSQCALDIGERHRNPNGVAHGAVLYAMADTGMGAALFATLQPGERCATIQITMNYFKPVAAGPVTCTTDAGQPRQERRPSRVAPLCGGTRWWPRRTATTRSTRQARKRAEAADGHRTEQGATRAGGRLDRALLPGEHGRAHRQHPGRRAAQFPPRGDRPQHLQQGDRRRAGPAPMRVGELDIECHADEFGYWRKFDRKRQP